MLWRIAPEMFQDKRYQCVTLSEVHDEIYQTQKFKEKYPWRGEFKPKIKTLPPSISDGQATQAHLKTISALDQLGITDKKTGRCISLSRVDKKILACSLANGYRLSTVEKAVVLFAKQEFPNEFKGVIFPLEIINMWLETGLIKWDADKQAILAEWREKNETRQPTHAIKKFKKLTRYPYLGT